MAGIKTGISGQINNNIITDGLVFYVDPAYKRSYPGSGTNINNLITPSITGSLESGTTFETNNNGIFSFQLFDKILDIVANNWENWYVGISILCCSGHALGIFGNESFVSSTFLAIGLLAGGSTHLKSLNSFERLSIIDSLFTL